MEAIRVVTSISRIRKSGCWLGCKSAVIIVSVASRYLVEVGSFRGEDGFEIASQGFEPIHLVVKGAEYRRRANSDSVTARSDEVGIAG